jgi:pimeloyl-ACP methyl ester carboxylesterase
MIRSIPLLAMLALVALCGLAACGDAGRDARTLALGECRLPRLPQAAQCGTLEVPEDRSRPGGRKIKLHVAVLPANTLSPKPDPLFILAGGPGQAASTLGPFAAQLNDVRTTRDVVLVDQRGTGRSAPLDCKAFAPDERLEAAIETDPLPRARACAQELAASGIDAAQYTTGAWVDDLEAVRQALGYPRVNLWGGSYGTRVALDYLRRYPERIRTAVLDGVAPPGIAITLDIWPTRERALEGVIAACAASASCRNAHPDLRASLGALESMLGAAGREIEVADPRTGNPRRLTLSYPAVLALLQPMLYAPEGAALLPEVVGRAGAGDFGPLFATLSTVTADTGAQLNSALHFSVTCAEDVPRITAERREKVLASLPTAAIVRPVLAVCDVWPKGKLPADFATPVTSDIPVLLLSGGLDPVTPPAYGDEVARTLKNSRHVIAPGYGHIVSAHACGPRLVARFIDDAGFAKLPETCLAHFAASPRPLLWPDRLGPQP